MPQDTKLSPLRGIPRDLLIAIGKSFFSFADIRNLTLVSKYFYDLAMDIRRNLSPQMAVTTINQTNACVSTTALKINCSDLRQHWPGSEEEFIRLCATRTFAYINSPRTSESILFTDRLATLSFEALSDPVNSFLRNPYLTDLVILNFVIEVFVRNSDLLVIDKDNLLVKLSDLIKRLIETITRDETLKLQEKDPARVCLFYRTNYATFDEFLAFWKPLSNAYVSTYFEGFYQAEINRERYKAWFLELAVYLFINPLLVARHSTKFRSFDSNSMVSTFNDMSWVLSRSEHSDVDSLLNYQADVRELLFSGPQGVYIRNFFTQKNALRGGDAVKTVYQNAIFFLAKHNCQQNKYLWLEAIFNTSIPVLQARIATLPTGVLAEFGHICLLLMLNPDLNITAAFLQNTFGGIPRWNLEPLLLIFFSLDKEKLCYLISLKFSDVNFFIKVILLFQYLTATLFNLLTKNFLTLHQLLGMQVSSRTLLNSIIQAVPEKHHTPAILTEILARFNEQFKKETIIDVINRRTMHAVKDLDKFFRKLYQLSPCPMETHILQILKSDVLWDLVRAFCRGKLRFVHLAEVYQFLKIPLPTQLSGINPGNVPAAVFTKRPSSNALNELDGERQKFLKSDGPQSEGSGDLDTLLDAIDTAEIPEELPEIPEVNFNA